MSYVRMSDLGQVSIASGGGGGAIVGGGYAQQATQARGYVMPGHTPPVSIATTPTGPGGPSIVAPPTSAPPTSTPPTSTPPTGGGGGGGGGSAVGQRQRRGRIEGEDVYRTEWEVSRTTITPGYTIRETLPHYIEGQSDPYNEFGPSAVDEGGEEEREFIDTTGGQQAIPAGPQKVYLIEDDPTLHGLESSGAVSRQVNWAVSSQVSWGQIVGACLVGVGAGVAGAVALSRIWGSRS